MEAWKGIRTSVSFTERSSAVPKGFVSALPSRYDVPARCARAKEILENTLTLLRGGGGFGRRINHAAAVPRFASWSIPQRYPGDAMELPDVPAPIPAIAHPVRDARNGSPNTQQRLAH
jgi:hypothetical protein